MPMPPAISRAACRGPRVNSFSGGSMRNLVPVTAAGKIGTTVLIFLGIGVFALAIQHIGETAVRRRARRIKAKQRVSTERPGQKDTAT